ncbi:hypothetical protein HBH69_219980 [Parastagonospora nodorum]|nr:hypothetical protein HBH82_230320 [Parastagonospora nodorum]KAH4661415.1 hypothetical protein HBH78_222350 [Parastagonospora nodorum]KAH4691507.1 hypothetical protein HBH67_243260 [Parastagonospora nodorum]KAH4755749.1 hypothetical protein HBH63_231150 [Parastagonospora nodorum]KAH4769804.1 hypothetical protein HBH62_227790 [Parastagonospora nodorum]
MARFIAILVFILDSVISGQIVAVRLTFSKSVHCFGKPVYVELFMATKHLESVLSEQEGWPMSFSVKPVRRGMGRTAGRTVDQRTAWIGRVREGIVSGLARVRLPGWLTGCPCQRASLVLQEGSPEKAREVLDPSQAAAKGQATAYLKRKVETSDRR